MQCPFWKEQINDGATVCRFCGKEQFQEKQRKTEQRARTIVAIVMVLFAVVVGIMVLSSLTGTESGQEIAAAYQQQCIDNKGYGQWFGSSGVSLEQFCKGVGLAQAAKDRCRDHPESC